MNAKILNRDFTHPSDGWYMIEPKGDHPNRTSKLVQVIDAEAMTAIVNRFNADAQAGKLSHGEEMLIDHEHFKHDTDKESRAYGWLQELQNRDDGIYGRIRWTATGKAAVDGGDYRFFSTEYDPGDLKVLNSATPRRVRPLRLDGLTLTNDPNNKGGKPITNRKDFADADASAANQKQKETKSMKSIATKLGLAAEASEDAILAEVTKIINRAETAERELTPIKNRITELETETKTLLADQVEALLDSHGVKEEKVRNRIKGVLATLKNREERIGALADFGFKLLGAKTEKPQARVLNRGEVKTPETTETAAALTPEQFNAEVRKIMNRDGVKFEPAYNTLRQEKPELFS